ncbi:MAG: sugar ABC transporter permease [Chloroflexi bacterium]|nr:sugar ABC transporter permease [Chloroflexota bacterium]
MQRAEQRSDVVTGQVDIARLAISIVGVVGLILVLWWSFNFMSSEEVPRLAIAAVALAVGVFGIWALFFFSDNLVTQLPIRIASAIRPFVFVGPAIAVLTAFLVYPTINTLYLSLFNRDSSRFVGLENYVTAFTDGDFLLIFRNNIIWLIFVTAFAVGFGLLVAVLADRVKGEPVVKSFIFMPMAISFVGASVIWRFVYAFKPEGTEQIGLLNAIWTGLGGEPVAWITKRSIDIPGVTAFFDNLLGVTVGIPLNTLMLIIIMIWLQTGFAMVIISAAIKGVPSELLEAARIDGATEIQAFFRVTIPFISTTILTVATTILILVLKVFDIVFVMTSGQFATQVIANEMYMQMFRWRDFGMGSALAVILFLAVIPVIINNIRRWQEERYAR